jgi:hypothetical protein
MPRRRRYSGYQATARAVARVHRQPLIPRGIPPDQWAAYLHAYRAELQRVRLFFRKRFHRDLNQWERLAVKESVVRAIQGRLADNARQIRQLRKGVDLAPPTQHMRPALVLGPGRGGAGSTGLGGRITRRLGRSPRRYKLVKPRWIDPYPWIPGTVPEKMIFAELVRRHIYFVFHGTPDDFAEADILAFYAPTLHDFDFLLPEWQVVIDPYSEFHHSQPDTVQRDITRRVVLLAQGWKYYTPWAHEVVADAGKVVDQITELHTAPTHKLSEKDQQAKRERGYRLGAALGTGAFAVGIANRRRRRGPTLRLG